MAVDLVGHAFWNDSSNESLWNSDIEDLKSKKDFEMKRSSAGCCLQCDTPRSIINLDSKVLYQTLKTTGLPLDNYFEIRNYLLDCFEPTTNNFSLMHGDFHISPNVTRVYSK